MFGGDNAEETSGYEDVTGRQKVAVLLLCLGPAMAAEIYKHLGNEEIEIITLELATIGKVDTELKSRVLEEFHRIAVSKEFINEGGIDYAREVLDRALGPEKAAAVIERLSGSLQVSPFEFLKKSDPAQILHLIQNEHPQTIALILSHLDTGQSAYILSELPSTIQSEVATRIAVMDRTSPEIIAEIERVLEGKIEASVGSDFTLAGGVKALSEVLNMVDRATEKAIMESLEESNPDLATEVKKLMFVFEDVTLLADQAIQQVLKEIDTKELVMALKGASEEVKDKIFRNMSNRAVEMVKEDMEFTGPIKLKVAEESQQRIVNVIRKLEEAGEIVISRGGESDAYV